MHPAIPLVHWRGVRYSVPTRALGQTVEVPQPVDSEVFTVRWAGQTIATHTQAVTASDEPPRLFRPYATIRGARFRSLAAG